MSMRVREREREGGKGRDWGGEGVNIYIVFYCTSILFIFPSDACMTLYLLVT